MNSNRLDDANEFVILRDVTKTFGSLHALNATSLGIREKMPKENKL